MGIKKNRKMKMMIFSKKSFLSIDVSGLRRYSTLREECNGMDGRGLPAPKSDDELVPLSIGTSWHTTATTPAL
jgi:hypothetical protein